MVEFTGTWTDDEVERFLSESTIPMRIATQRGDGSPWMVTLWYRYRDGSFECATGTNADIVRFLRNEPTVAFDISTNRPPYRGVRGNGAAELSPDTNKTTLRSLIERYLGGTESELAGQLLSKGRDEIRIRIHPDELFSWDYSDRMKDV